MLDHVVLNISDVAAAKAFYESALAPLGMKLVMEYPEGLGFGGADGGDHGAPGPRPMYHEHYYGGFVLDPDGNNIEAVCHLPQA